MSRLMRVRRDDTGAGTVDYVGMVTVAAVVAVAVGLAAMSVQPSNAVIQAICKVVSFGQGDCGDSRPTLADRKPSQPCVIASNSSTNVLRAGVAVIGQGSERWLIEELGDGRFRMSRATGEGVGVTTGVGFDVTGTYNDQDYGFSLGAEANALLVDETGEVYYADSREQAEKFLNERRWDQGLDGTVGDSGPVRWLADKIRGEDPLPEPDETWVAGGAIADGKATVDWIAMGAQAEADASVLLGARLRKDGSGTAYFSVSLSGQAAASMWAADSKTGASTLYKGQLAGTVKGVMEVDYDAAGDAQTFRLKTTLGGQAQAGQRVVGEKDLDGPGANSYTDRMYELPLDSAADRQYAAGVAATLGIPFVPGVSDRIRTNNPPTPENLADLVGFAGAVADHGKMWEDDYDLNLNTDLALNLDAEYITGVIVDASSSSVERTSKGQRYFDGTGWREREGCSS
jgi:hypothetical protein